ncbi:MAG: hypothetical protein J0H42_04285 [Rhizobiales bacterium]|nr:hypothetical protein [Hyphomicrobiales bacterium]
MSPAVEASPHLLRVLVRQNEEALRGLHRMPPADVDSAAGRQHWMTVDELRAQTILLCERLDRFMRDPPPPRKRKSWRDILPPSA